VVLDAPDREGQIDLQRADLRVDLVRGAEIDGCEPSEDLVPLGDVALVEAVVRLDRRPRDAVELEELRLQLAGPDLDEVGHRFLQGRGGNARSISLAGPNSYREEQAMAFSVPDLTYPFDALEPHIDARTMEIHHDKHHAAYVTNLNAALEGTPWADQSLDTILTSLDSIPEGKRAAVRNNGGGHANHSLFWEIMGPNGGGDPTGDLADAIANAFGGVADLKAAVNDAGVKRFGSGWTWLVWDGTGLAVRSTPNQDTPVMEGQAPILGIDVWEHAYYLNYQNRRPDYLEAWWNVVDWDAVATKFATARG
jgi:Fe-Mn family superoxide dismutase